MNGGVKAGLGAWYGAEFRGSSHNLRGPGNENLCGGAFFPCMGADSGATYWHNTPKWGDMPQIEARR